MFKKYKQAIICTTIFILLILGASKMVDRDYNKRMDLVDNVEYLDQYVDFREMMYGTLLYGDNLLEYPDLEDRFWFDDVREVSVEINQLLFEFNGMEKQKGTLKKLDKSLRKDVEQFEKTSDMIFEVYSNKKDKDINKARKEIMKCVENMDRTDRIFMDIVNKYY